MVVEFYSVQLFANHFSRQPEPKAENALNFKNIPVNLAERLLS